MKDFIFVIPTRHFRMWTLFLCLKWKGLQLPLEDSIIHVLFFFFFLTGFKIFNSRYHSFSMLFRHYRQTLFNGSINWVLFLWQLLATIWQFRPWRAGGISAAWNSSSETCSPKATSVCSSITGWPEKKSGSFECLWKTVTISWPGRRPEVRTRGGRLGRFRCIKGSPLPRVSFLKQNVARANAGKLQWTASCCSQACVQMTFYLRLAECYSALLSFCLYVLSVLCFLIQHHRSPHCRNNKMKNHNLPTETLL